METHEVKKLDLYQLPAKGNIVSYYSKLMEDGLIKTDAISSISATVIDIWNRADCPCIDYKHVKNRGGDLLQNYRCRLTVRGDNTPVVTHQRKKNPSKLHQHTNLHAILNMNHHYLTLPYLSL
jgi:hypothetical protein